MRLGEALRIIGRPPSGKQRSLHLLCGFQPLHLETFIKAHARVRYCDDEVRLHTGLYDDLEGNIERASQIAAEGAVVCIEWGDLDRRLAFRASAGYGSERLADVAEQAREKCRRIQALLGALAARMPVVVLALTLPLPPLAHTPPWEASAFELDLNAVVDEFLQALSRLENVRVASAAWLAMESPAPSRHDVKMELLTGFPYTMAHADIVAALSVNCIFRIQPKKGLITDLDRTAWKEILGDVGVDGVSWSLEHKSHAHALYQQVLNSLAESGILIAIASKNDPETVTAVLHRPDLLIRPDQIFPVVANWGPKSESVAAILKAWNVGADSVVFVDDSPMEIAEVSEQYPEMECLLFPSEDPAGIVALLRQLRARFGKNEIREEDRLRLRSLQSAQELQKERPAGTSEDFLARLEAKLTFEPSGTDPRALELVNKTNQFNLNGVRFTETSWRERSTRPGDFLATVSYEDRFGPLGRIAVVGGRIENSRCLVDIWVISCRAFSRQIEFQVIRQLFRKTQAFSIRFLYRPTERNGPTQTFFREFFPDGIPQGEELELPLAVFERHCPTMLHRVDDQWITSEAN